MGIRINQNIMALNSYRNLTTSESQLSKSLEKLSSGFRINKAADDASGLVISEGLRSQVMGLRMAIKNTQDGISVVQTAEGALTEVHSLLQRVRELAVQAASTGSSDQASRDAAQAEVSQLLDEIDRISNTTRFGGQTLLNGSYGAIEASDGVESTDAVAARVTGATAPLANFINDFTATPESFNLSIDGGPAFTVTLATEDLSAAATAADIETGLQNELDIALAANGLAGAVDVEVAEPTVGNFQVSLVRTVTTAGTSLTLSNAAAADPFFEDWFGVGATVLTDDVIASVDAVAGNFASQNGQAILQGAVVDKTALLVNYQGGQAAGFDLVVNGAAPATVTLDVDARGFTREEFEDAVQAAVDDAVGTDAVSVNIIEAGNDEWQVELRTVASGNGNTLSVAAGGTLSLELFGNDTDVLGEGAALPVPGIAYAAGDTSGGGLFQVGASSGETIEFVIGDTDTFALGIDNIDVAADAQSAMDLIDLAIEEISVLRGDLGALQNRFEHTINNLSVTMENLSASESRIRDTDMASEMMQFTRAQILQQAGTAMLAQANAVPQSVLQLLQ